MMLLRTYGLLLAAILLAAPAAAAQDITVRASVDATTVGVDETVTYTLEVEGVSLTHIEMPDPPETDGLVLLQSSPVTQSDVSYSNGELRRETTFQWRYQPLREGTARLQPTSVTAGGETYRTDAIELRVVSQAQRPSRPPTLSGPPARNPGSSAPSARDESNAGESDLFIRAEAGAEEAYVGEQVSLTYRLYYREGLRLQGSRLAGAWDAAGFWREDLDVASRPIPRTTTIEGESYRAITLKRVAVFPTRAGSLHVDPLRIETEVQRRRGRPLSRFFSGAGPSERTEVASAPIALRVRPLPGGAPATFEGAVGAFQMDVQLSRTEAEVGASVELQVRLSGKGNLATLDPPALDLPDAFERFDPDVNTTVNRSGTYVRGTKTFTYTLVPQENGAFALAPVVFSYFDPEDEQYKTLREELPALRVTGEQEAPVAEGTTGEGLPVGDIAEPIPSASSWTRTDATPLHESPWAYAALLVPALLVAGLLAYRRLQEPSDTPHARRQHAQAVARRHLERARELHEKDKPRLFYEEIERAVLGFIGRRLRLAPQGLTHPQLDARLKAADVPTETRHALLDLLDECDRARFAPVDPDATAFQTAHERTRALLADLHRHLG